MKSVESLNTARVIIHGSDTATAGQSCSTLRMLRVVTSSATAETAIKAKPSFFDDAARPSRTAPREIDPRRRKSSPAQPKAITPASASPIHRLSVGNAMASVASAGRFTSSANIPREIASTDAQRKT